MNGNEINEKNCGRPVKKGQAALPKFSAGTCKICGKKNVKVLSVNELMTACQNCYDYLIIPRRSGRV